MRKRKQIKKNSQPNADKYDLFCLFFFTINCLENWHEGDVCGKYEKKNNSRKVTFQNT